MKTTIRTNSKEFNAKVFQYLLNAIDSDEHSLTDDKIKLLYIRDCFEKEYNHDYNKKYIPNDQKRLAEWFSGLPSSINIDFENYKILELAREWGTLAPRGTSGSKATEKREDAIIANWFSLMAFKLMQLSEKHGITYHK